MTRKPIVLHHEHADAIRAHALADAPNECCGILAGVMEADRILVREVHPADNVWEGERTHRFLLDPRAQLRVQRDCRERGLSVVGFYHSHPEGAAVPSGFDTELAWPEMSYVIVALRDGRFHELRSWQLDEPSRRFVEQIVQLDAGE